MTLFQVNRLVMSCRFEEYVEMSPGVSCVQPQCQVCYFECPFLSGSPESGCPISASFANLSCT